MIKEGTEIMIISSTRLREMRLSPLAGATGIITENLSQKERKNKGCMVCLETPYMEEYIWFIPIESIRTNE